MKGISSGLLKTCLGRGLVTLWDNEFVMVLVVIPAGVLLTGAVVGLVSHKAWVGLVIGLLVSTLFAWRVHQPGILQFYLPYYSLAGFLGSGLAWGGRQLLRRRSH